METGVRCFLYRATGLQKKIAPCLSGCQTLTGQEPDSEAGSREQGSLGQGKLELKSRIQLLT